MMKRYSPVYLNEIGNRANNEDAIYPIAPSEEDRLFLVCDGVGGQNKGEEASRIVCQAFPKYVLKNKKVSNVPIWLDKGLNYVESEMVKYLDAHPFSSGMATTLTLLYFQKKKNEAIIGWVGDSRVYHIRDGKILFQTKDHSLVQSMVDMGEITEEEAETHPQKNVITRAVKGTEPSSITYKVIDDIRANDFFFLCSDGILERLGKEEISNWFLTQTSPEEIKEKIFEAAQGNTQDNFSMYLIKIKNGKNQKESTSTSVLEALKKRMNNKGLLLTCLVVLGIILGVIVFI